jgi:SAM-dependent methyltransferase
MSEQHAEFYHSPLAASTYDLLTAQANPQVQGDVAFYLDCAHRFGGPVLELGVGTGRVAWPLVEVGFAVTGLDGAPPMLAEARRKGAARPAEQRARLRLEQGDMAAFDLGATFALALIPFSAFQHLAEPAAQRACLARAHRHLQPGGHLVLDVFDPWLDRCVPDAITPNPDREARDPVTGQRICRRSIRRQNDPLRQLILETFRIELFAADGTLLASQDGTHALRWACRQEMRYLFELTGFAVVAEYSDFERAPPAYGQRQIWVVRRG